MWSLKILSLFLFFKSITNSSNCPDKCQCQFIDTLHEFYEVNCIDLQMTAIPRSIPKFTTHLNLHNNQIRIVRVDELNYLRDLKMLNLSKNNISDFQDATFGGLTLETLILTNNTYFNWKSAIQNNLGAINWNYMKDLYIDYTGLYSSDFNDLIQNCLCEKPLKTLILSNNLLFSDANFVFSKCFLNVTVLSIVGNQIYFNTSKTMDLLNMTSIEYLYIGGQHVTNSYKIDRPICTPNIACPIPLPPTLKLLDVSQFGLQLPKVPYNVHFVTKTHLKTLLASDCGVRELTYKLFCVYPLSIETFDVSANGLTKFNTDVFSDATCNFSSISSLDLSKNILGDVFDTQQANNFLKYLKGLIFLNLQENYISQLHPRTFENNTNIVNLDLSYNTLEDLTFHVDQMKKLQYINLSSNRIQCLSSGAVSSLRKAILQNSELVVNLQNNDFICSCSCLNFLELMQMYPSMFVNFEEMHCIFNGEKLSFKRLQVVLYKVNHKCKVQYWDWRILGWIIGVYILIVPACSWFYRYRFDMKFFRIRFLHTWRKKEGLKRVPKEFHAFVAHSKENSLWVVDFLVPNLEKDYGLKIRYHQKHFKNQFISQNIIESISISHATILIVSNASVQKKWWQEELMQSVQRAISEDDHEVFFIINEPLVENKIAPNILLFLKAYIRNFTCYAKTDPDLIKKIGDELIKK